MLLRLKVLCAAAGAEDASLPSAAQGGSAFMLAKRGLRLVGGASALVALMCVLSTLRAQSSRSICNFTHYSNNNNNNLTSNMHLTTHHRTLSRGARSASV
jgi:hypothetical protein